MKEPINSYTLVLTSGMTFVDVRCGTAISDAMLKGKTTVTVDIDFNGAGSPRQNVLLAVANIVALIPNAAPLCELDEIPEGIGNVHDLGLRRRQNEKREH